MKFLMEYMIYQSLEEEFEKYIKYFIAIWVFQDKYLIVKNQRWWGLLWGKINDNENVKDAIKREFFEEIQNTDIKVKRIIWYKRYLKALEYWVYYEVELNNNIIKPNNEVTDYKFINYSTIQNSSLIEWDKKIITLYQKNHNENTPY